MRAQPEERGRRLAHRPALDRQAAHQQEAAAGQHFVPHACRELGPERGQREVAGRDRGDVGVACGQRLGRRLDLVDLGGAERHQPVVSPGHLRSIPGGGAGLLGRQLE